MCEAGTGLAVGPDMGRGGEGDRWMGISNGEAPGPLAQVADAKNTSLTPPNPQPQLKTVGSR